MQKKAATALISLLSALLLAVIFSSGSALADEKKPHPRPSDASATHAPHHEDDDEEDERDEHDELREQYGDVDQVFMPPLVVSDPNNQFNGAGRGPAKPLNPPVDSMVLPDATNIDPHANPPIDPKKIRATKNTPAQNFFEAATLAIGAMAAGSATLGAVAIRRTIKLRKTAKADYIYE
ncbi:MAG: hypothetical protein KA500_03065 [Rhodoluna sp.]|nr:hypothetical protein [Rhodoluna sp.]MBP6186819.1 hypothetical protein [Rhodoluna sp.]